MHATKIASFTMNGFFAHYPTFQNTECHRNRPLPECRAMAAGNFGNLYFGTD